MMTRFYYDAVVLSLTQKALEFIEKDELSCALSKILNSIQTTQYTHFSISN